MFEHWLRDQEQEYESLRGQSILIGSFTNPEMAQKMIKVDNPDFASTDEDFEKSAQMVLEDRNKTIPQEQAPQRKRKRRIASIEQSK